MTSSLPLKTRPRSLMRRWRDLPIRFKLTLAFMLVIVLSLAIVGYLVDQRSSRELREAVGLNLKNRAETRAQVLGEWIRHEAGELTALSFSFIHELRELNAGYPSDEAAQIRIEALREAENQGELIPPPSPNVEILQAYANSEAGQPSVLLTDRYGVLVTASDRIDKYVYADDEWWQAAWNNGSGATYVGNPEPSGEKDLVVVPIATPIRDPESGEMLGVMLGYMPLEGLYELVRSVQIGKTGRAILLFPGAMALNENSTLRPIDPVERDNLARVVDQEFAELPIDGKQSLTSQAEIPLEGIARPTDSAWRLLIVQDVEESLEPVQAARATRLQVGIVALILGSGIGYLVSRMLTRSVSRLAKTVQEFGGGDYGKRMDVNRSDEIGQLGTAFNEMADAIQTREIELQQWSSTLDRLVKDRTSELLTTNESLQQEITERQRIQFEVMLERIRLEALIESSHDGLILISTDQQIQVINQMALRLLDLPGIPHDWLRYQIGDLREMEDGTALEGLRLLGDVSPAKAETDSVQQGEFPVGDSLIQWLNLPVESDEVPFGRLIVLHDVTQQRMLESLRDDLIHTMVHDLRNPLGSIMVAMELFSDDPLSDEQRAMVNITRESLNRMANMVNAILDIGRLEAGSMPLDRAAVPLHEISTQIMQIQQPLAQQKTLTLVHDIPDTLPLIDVDRDMISRVVQNLVGNAIKFTPANGTITIVAEPHDGEMLVTIKDTGPGIAPDVRDRLFQKFATGKQKGRGSGLGLAFSRLAVEAHGGRIWVESTSGEGTTFKFTLPFADGNKEAATNGTRQGQGEQAPSP